MGLFGDDSFADVNELKIPKLEEIPKRTILQYEKELIGFYVTGNPLDAYVGSLYYYTPLRKISDASEVLDGKYFSVAGIISDCRIRNTRQGDSMAILTLEDFNGKMEIVVFQKFIVTLPGCFIRRMQSALKENSVSMNVNEKFRR